MSAQPHNSNGHFKFVIFCLKKIFRNSSYISTFTPLFSCHLILIFTKQFWVEMSRKKSEYLYFASLDRLFCFSFSFKDGGNSLICKALAFSLFFFRILFFVKCKATLSTWALFQTIAFDVKKSNLGNSDSIWETIFLPVFLEPKAVEYLKSGQKHQLKTWIRWHL